MSSIKGTKFYKHTIYEKETPVYTLPLTLFSKIFSYHFTRNISLHSPVFIYFFSSLFSSLDAKVRVYISKSSPGIRLNCSLAICNAIPCEKRNHFIFIILKTQPGTNKTQIFTSRTISRNPTSHIISFLVFLFIPL